jgi:surface protein
MFSSCYNLTTIFVDSDWSVDGVTLSDEMFFGCNSIVGGKGTTYDGNHVDKAYARIDGGSSNPGYLTGPQAYVVYTAENTTMTFYYDIYRSSRTGTTYDLNQGNHDPSWNTDGTRENVTKVIFDPSFARALPTSTYAWFSNMENLQSITGMRYLNTSEVTTMRFMFTHCHSLASVDMSHFNTAKVTNMYAMFYYCRSLTSLDLSSFDTHNVTDMDNMFYKCNKLHTIYGTDWDTGSVTASRVMFYGCYSLVGGMGTPYSHSCTDHNFARIDGGHIRLGYFTEKPAIIRGDVNGDGSVNISDVTALIDLLLGGGTISNPAADCNQDGIVNISDVTVLIDYVLSGHW